MPEEVNFKKSRLDNGTRVITTPLPQFRSVTVLVMFSAGSRYENRKINGLSHFMEHMFFKGAKRYPDAMKVAEAIDSVGGLFNAYTSEDKVAYFIKLSSGRKRIAYDLLSDMLLNSKFDEKEIDRERGVIVEEIRMYNDDPMSKVQIDFKNHFYGDQPLGWDIAGPEENIATITRDDFIDFQNRFYHGETCTISVAGDITHEENLALCEEFFTFTDKGSKPVADPFVAQSGGRSILTKRDIEQAHIMLGFPIPGDRHEDQPAIKVLNNALGGTMSSRLFHQVREQRGLAYYIRSSRSTYIDAGGIKISAGVNVDKVTEAVECIVAELRKVVTEGISDQECGKAKENINGRLDLSLEDSMASAGLCASQETLFGDIKGAAELVREINNVTPEMVRAVAEKYLDMSKIKMAILGPYDDISQYDDLLN